MPLPLILGSGLGTNLLNNVDMARIGIEVVRLLEPLVALMMVAFAILVTVMVQTRKYKGQLIWLPFFSVILLCSIWTAIYTMSIFLGQDAQAATIPIQFVFVIPSLPLTLLMIVIFTGRWNERWARSWPLLFVYPSINIVLVLTNPWHHLFIRSFNAYQYGGFTLVAFDPGILMWAYLAFCYIIFLIGVSILIWNIKGVAGIYRKRGVLLLIGVVLPVAGDMLFYSQFNPVPGATITPALFAVTGTLYWYAIFHYGLLEVMPAARDALWNSSPDAVFVLDRKGRIMDLNQAAGQMFKWATMELVGSLADPSSIPEQGLLGLFISSNQGAETYVSADGRFFQGRSADLRDRNGETIGKLVIISDVTSELKARKESERRQAMLSKIMEEAPFAIIIMDKGTGKPLFINWRTEELLKVRADQKEMFDPSSFFMHPSDRTRILQTIKEKGEARDFEVYMQDTQGKKFWAFLNGTIVNIEGKDCFFVSLHDISEQKLVEELRRTNRKLNLLSSITRHDLWNKYMAMTGYLELLRSMKNDDESKAMLDKLSASALEAQRLINFTSYYDKLGANPPSWCAIGDIVRNASTQLDLSDMNVHVEGREVQIYADPMIERAFYNLLDDSIRHGKTVRNIWVRSRRDGDKLTVVYEDDGQGIDPEIRPFLFQRGRGKNTGLGLFLTREILDITGIEIIEQGETGKGVRFVLTIPEGRFNTGDAKP